MSYTTTKRDADFLRRQAAGKAREAVRRDAADRAQQKQSAFDEVVATCMSGVDLVLDRAPDLAARITDTDREQMARELATSLMRRANRPRP